jgi:hypothetical protein
VAEQVTAKHPVRVQRKRTKGWKMPPGTVYVGRPTQFGNPFTPEQYWDAGYSGGFTVAMQHCVDAYRAWLEGRKHWAHGHHLPPMPSITGLRGKNLACWCQIGEPCHADVLLELANGPHGMSQHQRSEP